MQYEMCEIKFFYAFTYDIFIHLAVKYKIKICMHSPAKILYIYPHNMRSVKSILLQCMTVPNVAKITTNVSI